MGASSIYKRVTELEAYIPQLDAAQTENANELLRIIAMLANSHNRLVALMKEREMLPSNECIPREKFDDLIINVNEAMNDPK